MAGELWQKLITSPTSIIAPVGAGAAKILAAPAKAVMAIPKYTTAAAGRVTEAAAPAPTTAAGTGVVARAREAGFDEAFAEPMPRFKKPFPWAFAIGAVAVAWYLKKKKR